MKPTTTLALGALLSLAAAQPMMEKRDGNTVTVTDVVVVTVDVYTTVNGNPPAASSATTMNHANHVAYHAQNKAEAKAQPSPSSSPSPPAQPPAPVQQKAAVPASPPPAQPPTGSSPEEIQAAADAKQEAINQQQINTNNAQKQADFAHQNQMNAAQNGGPAPQAQPAAPQAPAPSASSPAAAAPQQPSTPSTGGGNGGSCGSIGGSCSGDVTIYNDQGLGACGWANDTNSQDFFALAARTSHMFFLSISLISPLLPPPPLSLFHTVKIR